VPINLSAVWRVSGWLHGWRALCAAGAVLVCPVRRVSYAASGSVCVGAARTRLPRQGTDAFGQRGAEVVTCTHTHSLGWPCTPPQLGYQRQAAAKTAAAKAAAAAIVTTATGQTALVEAEPGEIPDVSATVASMATITTAAEDGIQVAAGAEPPLPDDPWQEELAPLAALVPRLVPSASHLRYARLGPRHRETERGKHTHTHTHTRTRTHIYIHSPTTANTVTSGQPRVCRRCLLVYRPRRCQGSRSGRRLCVCPCSSLCACVW
jgi:hypothetical protein